MLLLTVCLGPPAIFPGMSRIFVTFDTRQNAEHARKRIRASPDEHDVFYADYVPGASEDPQRPDVPTTTLRFSGVRSLFELQKLKKKYDCYHRIESFSTGEA